MQAQVISNTANAARKITILLGKAYRMFMLAGSTGTGKTVSRIKKRKLAMYAMLCIITIAVLKNIVRIAVAACIMLSVYMVFKAITGGKK